MLSAPTRTAPAASSRVDQRRVGLGRRRSRLIFEPARVGRPFDVEQVLDRERRAGERADGFAPRARERRSRALSERALRDHVGEGAVSVVARLDAPERGARRPRRRSRRPSLTAVGDRDAPIRRASGVTAGTPGRALPRRRSRPDEKQAGLLGRDIRDENGHCGARFRRQRRSFSGGAMASTTRRRRRARPSCDRSPKAANGVVQPTMAP